MQDIHRDIQIATLGICMAMSALSCSLTADPSGLHAASPPYSCWDLMHAVQLTRLLMGSMESRRFDADAQVGWDVGKEWGESVGDNVGRKCGEDVARL